MTETAIKDINRFSWRRVWQFGNLYRQAIRNQTIIYVLILALLVLISSVYPREEVILGACCIIWFMSLAIPFVFILRDDTIIRLAPVKGSERLTFYLLWILLIFPVLMGAVQWLFMYIGWLFTPEGLMRFVIDSLKKTYELFSLGYIVFLYSSSCIWGLALYILITDAAITCRKHPILTAVIRTVLVFIAFTIISVTVGVAYALLDLPLSEGEVQDMMILIEALSATISLPIGIWALWHLYKYLK